MKIRYLFLVLMLISAGFYAYQMYNEQNKVTGNVVSVTNIVKDEGRVENVYFCPRDNCSSALAELILSANSSVHCAFFDLDLPDVIAALEEQKQKGVDVRVVVDTDNYKWVKEVKFPVKQDNRSAYMHNKFCVVDGIKISSGSMNPTENCAYKNNNNLIIISSVMLARNYEDEFSEFWKGVFGKGSKVNIPVIELNGTRVENYFCPEDSCGYHIEQEIKKAKKSIYFIMFSFTHTGIANEIVMKMQQGVEVKGVFEKQQASSEYSRFKLLDYQGADVRLDNNSAVMHHKVIIIDNSTLITGSFNPSKNADTKNDENIIIIENPEAASKYLEEFEYVWNNYSRD